MFPIICEIHAELYSADAYAIYASCMYQPTRAKYESAIDDYLSRPDILCLGAFFKNTLVGILIASGGEILGVAVREDMRRQNIGRALINHAMKTSSVLTAETDEDSIGFYRSCGFFCTPFTRSFPDGSCVRYRCKLHA